MCVGQIRALVRRNSKYSEFGIDTDAKTHRIAAELVKLHKAARRDQKRARRLILRGPDPSLRCQFYWLRGIVCAKLPKSPSH